jgi:hypothetical protein
VICNQLKVVLRGLDPRIHVFFSLEAVGGQDKPGQDETRRADFVPYRAARFAEIAVRAIFQGVLVTIVSLLLYGRVVAILGASGGAAFGAVVPALSAAKRETDWVGIVLISAGVYLASGGPLSSRNLKPREDFVPALERSRWAMFDLAFESI